MVVGKDFVAYWIDNQTLVGPLSNTPKQWTPNPTDVHLTSSGY